MRPEGAGADLGPVIEISRHRIAQYRSVIAEHHGQPAVHHRPDNARHGLPVGELQPQARAGRDRQGCPDLSHHHAVQRQHRQGAVLKHHAAYIVVRLGIDRLDAPRRLGVQSRRRSAAALLTHLFRKGVQAVLHLTHGAQEGHAVHLGQSLVLFDTLAVLDEIVQNLDGIRDFYLDRVLGRKGSAPGEGIFDLALLGLRREDARLVRIRGPARQIRQDCQAGSHQGQHNPADDSFDGFLFLHGMRPLSRRSAGHRSASSLRPGSPGTGRK